MNFFLHPKFKSNVSAALIACLAVISLSAYGETIQLLYEDNGMVREVRVTLDTFGKSKTTTQLRQIKLEEIPTGIKTLEQSLHLNTEVITMDEGRIAQSLAKIAVIKQRLNAQPKLSTQETERLQKEKDAQMIEHHSSESGLAVAQAERVKLLARLNLFKKMLHHDESVPTNPNAGQSAPQTVPQKISK